MNQKHSHIIDYRNAKYQGNINLSSQRNGLGVLIDDYLSFYVSSWKSNHLSGNTILYLSHSKYIYGLWKNNQPHGLNVFRIGDTVLLASLQNGQINHRALVIFQKFNFIVVLEKYTVPQFQQLYDFKVIQSGQIISHQDLLNYIKLLNVHVPEHYFSLLKFIYLMTNQSIKTKKLISGHHYFGFDQGLAIIFNSRNAVVSVGVHSKGILSQFGGKFTQKQAQQGNFQTKQTIKYKRQRPDNQINSIFQNIHKRSLFFKNHYFYSKIKTLSSIQNLLRGKLTQIVQSARKQHRKFTVNDLNQSLDYNVLNQFEEQQISINRGNIYQSPFYKMMKNVKPQFYEENFKLKNKIRPDISKSPKNQNIKTNKKIIDDFDRQIGNGRKNLYFAENKQTVQSKNQKFIKNNKINQRSNGKIKQNSNQKLKQKSLIKSKSKTKCLQISFYEDTLNPTQRQNLRKLSKSLERQNFKNDSKTINKKNKNQILKQNEFKIKKNNQHEKQNIKEITHFKNNRPNKQKNKQQQVNYNPKTQKYICYESSSIKNQFDSLRQQQQNLRNRSQKKLSQTPCGLNSKYQHLNQKRSKLLHSFKKLNNYEQYDKNNYNYQNRIKRFEQSCQYQGEQYKNQNYTPPSSFSISKKKSQLLQINNYNQNRQGMRIINLKNDYSEKIINSINKTLNYNEQKQQYLKYNQQIQQNMSKKGYFNKGRNQIKQYKYYFS